MRKSRIAIATTLGLTAVGLTVVGCSSDDTSAVVAASPTTTNKVTPSSVAPVAASTPAPLPQQYGAGPDSQFLGSLTKYTFVKQTDADLISVAHKLCEGMAVPNSAGLVRGALTSSGFGEATDDLILSAVFAYCPDLIGNIPARG